MSEKRTSTESRIPNDQQTTEDSDAVFRQVDDAKGGKFASSSDTTLQDIPIEILQFILIKVITMEVKNMKLAKSVWKGKADLVISRLGSVCSHWSSVLTTDFFRLELHRALDGIAQETIRMEIVEEAVIPVDCYYVQGIATLKDEILLFCRRKTLMNGVPIHSGHNIKIYDRNNMAEVKDVIELTGYHYWLMAACNVSKCRPIYLLKEKRTFKLQCDSVLRIAKDEDQNFNIQSWISDLRYPVDSISVSDEGGIMLSSTQDDELGPNVVSVYDPNGLLLHEVILSQDVYGFKSIDGCVMRKSDANFVLGSVNEQREVELTEIDTDGIIQRQYKSSLEQMSYKSFMSFADASGRILIHDVQNGIELLDSELNLLEFTGPQSNRYGHAYYRCLHFNSQRNEVVGICSVGPDTGLLKIFRFTED